MTYTIVGVIGHIDHGKTSLVAALTGVDTDTHPEEKRRGITIDLGFAAFTHDGHTFALIDAPGHQRYIGNLLAGVSAVDLGLLVVAADQGIQAQTLEHAAILQSLGVRQLIVVISRIDLADDAARLALVEELDLFLADFGFVDVPKVSLSTVTGEGLDSLRSLLVQFAKFSQPASSQYFRMPIDRAFVIEGRGAVVAGTPWSGSVEVGGHLKVARTGQRVRVREIEVHGESVQRSALGMRTAMNVVGISGQISRGDELVDEATHRMTNRLIVMMTMFRDAIELKCPATVHLHTATTACASRISGVKRIAKGESAIVLIETEAPIVATFGQACLFRRPYPVGSFAGGRILGTIESSERHRTKQLLTLGQQLAGAQAADRITAWVEYLGQWSIDPQDLELRMGIPLIQQESAIATALASGRISSPIPGQLVSTYRIESIRRYLEKLLKHQAEATEQAWLDEAAVVERAVSIATPSVIRWVIDQLVSENLLVRANKMVASASQQTLLPKKQRARLEQILQIFAGNRTPPTTKELAAQLQTTMEVVTSLIRFATQQGILVDLGSGFLLDQNALIAICKDLKILFDQRSQQTVASIRDHLGITRKHAIPLLEHCDSVDITRRDGDCRIAGPELDRILTEHHDEAD